MKGLRIAVVTPTFPPKSGGIAAAHYNLFHLLRTRYEVMAFVYDDDEPSPTAGVVQRKTPSFLAKLLPSLLRVYLLRYDLHGDFPNCARTARTALGSWRLNRPLQRFSPDIVLVPDNNLPGYFLRKPGRSKFVWFCHHNFMRFQGHPLLDDNPWTDIEVSSSMERRALRKADAVVSPSEYMVREFRKAYPLPDLPMHVIPNFIAEDALAGIEPYPLRSELGVSGDVPIVCIPSGGTVPKGKKYAFEIVRRIQREVGGRIVFFISGVIPGDFAYELAHAGDSVLIHAPGHLPWQKQIARFMACDVVVSPALVENYSAALVEAHWLGKPVVTFDTGGNREIVQDGETGYVVPYLDVETLIGRTVSLLRNRALLLQFAAQAQAWARRTLGPERILGLYGKLFEELVA